MPDPRCENRHDAERPAGESSPASELRKTEEEKIYTESGVG